MIRVVPSKRCTHNRASEVAIHPLPTMATVTTVSASGQTAKKDYLCEISSSSSLRKLPRREAMQTPADLCSDAAGPASAVPMTRATRLGPRPSRPFTREAPAVAAGARTRAGAWCGGAGGGRRVCEAL